MTTRWLPGAVLAGGLALAGCADSAPTPPNGSGGSPVTVSPSPGPSGSPGGVPSTPGYPTPGPGTPTRSPGDGAGPSGTTTVSGTVQAGVEPNCLLLEGYLLVGGPRDVLVPGARVTVTGEVRAGLMTTCQQGTPLQVRSATRS
ncbi:hypothetical protein [Plantactinospora sp. WMMB782]|uniref:hypothetical protein n=1 Tax=Plantactinospora sp. WMMB782 TaxID=3404121 RepID=UPI003B952436